MNRCIALGLLLLALLLSGCDRKKTQVDEALRTRLDSYAPSLVEVVASLPVQHDGRIKPFGTLAAFALYFTHGRRDLQFAWANANGGAAQAVTLSSTEWLLDIAMHQKQADAYPLFRVENRQVMDAIGYARDGGQRMDFDYISYADLLPCRDQLNEQAEGAGKHEGPEQSTLDRAILRLASQVRVYEELQGAFAPFALLFPLKGDALQKLYGKDHVSLVELLQKGNEFGAMVQQFAKSPADKAAGNVLEVGQWLASYGESQSEKIGFFPPKESLKAAEKWLTVGDLIRPAMQGRLPAEQMAMLESLDAACVGDPADSAPAWSLLHDRVVAAAALRGEQSRVAMEAGYYQWSLHYKALHIGFLPAFFCVLLLWLMPRSRVLWLFAFVLSAVGASFVIGDIVLRCLIRERPPITNLYDTFLFITSVGTVVALVTEVINRRRVALSIAPIFGSLLVMLARKFEVEDGQDTMKQLQAVLDSNYWLATHVTTINFGYAAGMIAALFGTAWLLMGALRICRNDEALHKSVVRMTYGATAFGLLLSVVGTILGGVWANDSWGRFWGWDTKENGALMICIAQAALLHARMSGMVRDFGFCVGAALTGCVVAFSWFHVNQLQVGLHNYGFSESTGQALAIYYASQLGLVLVGVVGRLLPVRAPTAAHGRMTQGALPTK
ncbi:MAG: cytochrome c biogenesis protein CcsA [Planctomycetota bacterium]|jgi:ABC-type transport system involved in cytochrome c biogenesis permease subunit|nr:cytochrome c biogenesis protein CcsA [Planctomycetota bacterium]